MYRYCLFIIFFLIPFFVRAQHYQVSGRVVNSKLEPLALVSIKIKGRPGGTISKEDGSYSLKLDEGKYDLIYTMVGYKPQIITLVITQDYVQNILLVEEEKNLAEAIVTSKLKDRAVEMIRNVIRHKEDLLAAAGPYSATVYIKATQEDSSQFKLKKGAKPLPDSVKLKMQQSSTYFRMAMAEIVSKLDFENRNKQKEERTGVVKRGDASSLFYLSATEADFNLYNNLLTAKKLSEVPFLSPISYSGLAAYRYKIIATTLSGKNKIYTISIRPRDLSNVTIEGEVTIMDSAWVITQAKFRLPVYHLPEYDFFEVGQQYEYVNGKAWMIARQEFTYFSKHNRGKLSGRTVAHFKDFEFNKTFHSRYFGTEISSANQKAYERDSLFWEQSRVEPLTEKEILFIHYRDSVYRATHTRQYLDSIDRLTNKVTLKKLFLDGQTFYNREKERSWYLPAIPSIYQPFQFGGGRIKLGAYYSRRYKSRKTISVYGDISYGIRNQDLNGNFRLTKMYNPFNRAFFRVSGGRNFQYIFLGDAWINMLKRSNQYLNHSIGLGHGQEIFNGLFLYTDFDISLRESLSGYRTNHNFDSLLNFDNNQAIAFEPYNASYGKIKLAYTFRQKYVREPKEKIILGSKWPTVYAEWRKGIPGFFGSDVDFDYLEFGFEQNLKLGTTGISRYNIKTGSFPNKTDLRLVDYKFQRRGDPILFSNPDDSFQSLDSTFPLFKRFYEAHYVHEFNGAIANRIPLFKKLKLREIAGGGFLSAPERNITYLEIFGGLERVFKWPFDKLQKFKLGVYVVASSANGTNQKLQVKVGITSWDKSRDRWY